MGEEHGIRVFFDGKIFACEAPTSNFVEFNATLSELKGGRGALIEAHETSPQEICVVPAYKHPSHWVS